MNEEQIKFIQTEPKDIIDSWVLGTSEKAIARFKRAGREYRIKTEQGEFWLVPTRTSQARIEITPDEMRDAPLSARNKVQFVQQSLDLFGGKIVQVKEG